MSPARADEARVIDLLHETVAKAAALEGVRHAFTVDHWSSENAFAGNTLFQIFYSQTREFISDIEVIDPADLHAPQD